MTTAGIDILLVEDNPRDVEMTLRALNKHNLANKVHVVKDGAEALDFIFSRGAYPRKDLNHVPKVVLLDLKLPKVSGLEVLRAIKGDAQARYPGGDPDVLAGRERHGRKLPVRGQQLHRQARGLRQVRRGGRAAWLVLADHQQTAGLISERGPP